VFSAHWEEPKIKISSGATHPLLYDYGGFPKETYEYKYGAAGDPKLANDILQLLKAAEIPAELEEKRGWDHGVFVPLLLMFPEANIPVVQVSLHSSLDPTFHSRLGAALRSLRERGVLLLGSGYTFHNMRTFFSPSTDTISASKSFDTWLQSALTNKDESARRKTLAEWKTAPGAHLCHPREEHLVPVFVASGAGGESPAKVVFHEEAPFAVSSYSFD